MTDAPKLKPCPFCGTAPELRTTYGSEVVGYAVSYSIRCPRCFASHGATDRQNPEGGYALDTGKAEAFERWNLRALPAANLSSPLGADVRALVLDGQLRALERAADGIPLARCMDLPDDLPTHADLSSPLGAVVMRDAALKAIMDIWAELLPKMSELELQHPAQSEIDAIAALPLPDHATLLAHAMRLPEVAALVEALKWYDDPSSQGDVACTALAALEAKP